MTALIVDDDYKCIELIRQIISINCLEITNIHSARTAMEGVKMIQHVKPYIVFLDIMMPHHTGFDLLECFHDRNFQVIIVSGHDDIRQIAQQYQANAFIPKPLDVRLFTSELERVIQKSPPPFKHRCLFENHNTRVIQNKKIAIHTSKCIDYVTVDDIMRIEADGAYSFIHLTKPDKVLHTSIPLNKLQTLLPTHQFFRTHRSHLVNLQFVDNVYTEDNHRFQITIDGSNSRFDL